MQGQSRLDPSTWRPQTRIAANIASLRQLRAFNDTGGIAVNFDVMRAVAPDIALVGSQSETLSLWEIRSASGFVTKPKFNADLVTIRFVTDGVITYRHRSGTYQGSPTHATLVGFDDLSEVQTSEAFGAVAGTIAVTVLEASQAALTGGEHRALPPLEPVAEIATPGLTALFCTVRQVQRQIREAHPGSDFTFHLIQEILGYQLLSSWPKRTPPTLVRTPDVPSRSLRCALDYIEANLSVPLTLADIAAAAGISVRALQDKFRREFGRTPVQFITDERLARVHRDLSSARNGDLSVADIARRWGFAHMSDFGQRYRRAYGRPPSETRRGARSGH